MNSIKRRGLLRHKGYKPTRRGKPASEYLVKAADDGKLNSIAEDHVAASLAWYTELLGKVGATTHFISS